MRATLAAELEGGGVFVLTAGTLHDAAATLSTDTDSLYLLGIQLISPLVTGVILHKGAAYNLRSTRES